MGNSKTKPALKSPMPAESLLDMYFFDARSYLLETAAILDRIERAPGGNEALNDSRMKQLHEACDIIRNSTGNRAEQFLALFSDPA